MGLREAGDITVAVRGVPGGRPLISSLNSSHEPWGDLHGAPCTFSLAELGCGEGGRHRQGGGAGEAGIVAAGLHLLSPRHRGGH